MAGLLQSSGVAVEPWYDPLKPMTQEAYGRFLKLGGTGEIRGMYQNDGMWLVSCGFTIVTMTSGFGLLESGRVSSKDEVNIMVKIIVDVVFGGISYWMFGYGFAFGNAYYRNPFIGLGNFFYSPDDISNDDNQAWAYAVFFFQMSFATTTSTVVSAAMAERIRLRPYIVITFLMTIMHSIASHWIWSQDGFLFKMGAIDAAGCAVVHLVGGVAGMVSTIYLGPRQGRFEANNTSTMSNPTNALLGTFMLWWGWLGFNTGSTYGISDGKWKIVGRSAVVTILCSIGGGCTSIVMSLIVTKKCRINWLIDGLLASLVTSTAVVHSIRPAFSVLVGGVGSALALATYQISDKFRVDDPVGVIPVHVVAAIWGMLSVGLFGQSDGNVRGAGLGTPYNGLFYSGEFYLLGVQALACAVVIVWAAVMTWVSLVVLNRLPWHLRMTKYDEQLGADLVEHGLAGLNIARYNIEATPKREAMASVLRAVGRWKRKTRLNKEAREKGLPVTKLDKMFGRANGGPKAKPKSAAAKRPIATASGVRLDLDQGTAATANGTAPQAAQNAEPPRQNTASSGGRLKIGLSLWRKFNTARRIIPKTEKIVPTVSTITIPYQSQPTALTPPGTPLADSTGTNTTTG